MLLDIENEFNKTLDKNIVLCETVCSLYDIDQEYMIENSNFIMKANKVFDTIIQAIKKFTKDLIDSVRKKFSDISFKMKLNKLRKQLELNKDFKLKNDKKYKFKTIREAVSIIYKFDDDANKIVEALNSKQFQNREDFDKYADKLYNAWWDKWYKYVDLTDYDLIFAFPEDAYEYICNLEKNMRDSVNEKMLYAIDSHQEKVINNMKKKMKNKYIKEDANDMNQQQTEEGIETIKIKWYQKIANKIAITSKNIKSHIVKHPFEYITIVSSAIVTTLSLGKHARDTQAIISYQHKIREKKRHEEFEKERMKQVKIASANNIQKLMNDWDDNE